MDPRAVQHRDRLRALRARGDRPRHAARRRRRRRRGGRRRGAVPAVRRGHPVRACPAARGAVPRRHVRRGHALWRVPPVLLRRRGRAGAELRGSGRPAYRRSRRRRLRGRGGQPDRRARVYRQGAARAGAAAVLARPAGQGLLRTAGRARAAAARHRPRAGQGVRDGGAARGDRAGRRGPARDAERHAEPRRLQPRAACRGRAHPAASGDHLAHRRRAVRGAAGGRGDQDGAVGDGSGGSEAACLVQASGHMLSGD